MTVHFSAELLIILRDDDGDTSTRIRQMHIQQQNAVNGRHLSVIILFSTALLHTASIIAWVTKTIHLLGPVNKR